MTAEALETPKTNSDGGHLVGLSAMARHLDCARTTVVDLVDQRVLERRPDGKMDLDASRTAYIRYLRAARRPTPNSDFVNAKADLIRLRIREKNRDLISASECADRLERLHGVYVTGLSSLAARITRDIASRRVVDRAIFEVRREMGAVLAAMADKDGEP